MAPSLVRGPPYGRHVIVRGWWNVQGWPTPEEWSAWWAFCGVAVTAVASTVALVQLTAYLDDRRTQTRPFVIVDLAFRPDQMMQVEVKNVSSTPAAEVRLSVSPPFQSTASYNDSVLRKITSPGYVIRQLAPGRGIRWSLDSAVLYYRRPDLPQNYTVTATYEDPRTRRRTHKWQVWIRRTSRTYVDIFELSLDQWNEANIPTE